MFAQGKVTLLLVVMLTVLGAGAQANEVVNETVAARPDGTVEIESLSGSIKVSGWDRAEVEVRGTLGREAEGLDIDASGSRVNIKVEIRDDDHGGDGWGYRGGGGSHLEIHVPMASRVDVETVSADIEASSLSGELELESVSGRVTVSGRPGGLDLASVSGVVEVELAPDESDLETVSGDIEVGEAGGDLDAASVSGDIHVAGGEIEGGSFETVSGDIRVEAPVSGGGSVVMETMSGKVTVVAFVDQPATYHLETFSGDIVNELGPDARRTSEYAPGKEVDFSIGSGGPRIKIASFSGSVRLLQR